MVDHVGLPGRDNANLHRIELRLARNLLHQAGFVIVEESDLFRNPADDHSLNVYNDEIYRQTDRFLFKAVRPEKPE